MDVSPALSGILLSYSLPRVVGRRGGVVGVGGERWEGEGETKGEGVGGGERWGGEVSYGGCCCCCWYRRCHHDTIPLFPAVVSGDVLDDVTRPAESNTNSQ